MPDAEQGSVGSVPAAAAVAAGAPKAVTAAAHKLVRIVYHLLRFGKAYVKQTEQEDAEQVRQRLEKQLARRARELGYELKKIEAGPAAPPG